MSESLPILQSKLTAPPVTDIVLRPETLASFAAGGERRLLIVKAPAGYGKTSTTAFVAQRLGWHAAWYTLDRLDTDPFIFIRSLIACVGTRVEGFAEGLKGRLEEPNHLEMVEALTLLTSAFETEVQRDLRIILDDFQEAGSNAVCDVVDYLLAARGCPTRFVVLTRHDPGLKRSKLQLAKEIAEIDAEELRLTDDQAREVIMALSDWSPSTSDLHELVTVTEGWPASVVLVGRGAGSGTSAGDVLDDPRLKGDLFSYLAEQVYDRQTFDIQTFLKLSCCLETMTSELVRSATGFEDAVRYLAYLAANSLFTFQTEPGQYRYHRLFRDYLRHRATEDEGVEAYRAAQIRAAVASEALGYVMGAIELYLDAGEADSVVRLLAEGGDGLLQTATTAQLARWTARLPGTSRVMRGWRSLLGAHLHIALGNHDEALLRLQSAKSDFAAANDSRGTYLTAAATELMLFWKGDYSAAAQACMEALDLCTTRTDRAHIFNSLAAANANMCEWQLAERSWREAAELTEGSDDPERARIDYQQIGTLLNRGHFDETVKLAERLWPHAERVMPPSVVLAFLDVQAQAYLHIGSYELAGRCLDHAEEQLHLHGHRTLEPVLLETRGQLLIAQGDLRESVALLRFVADHPSSAHDTESRSYSLCHLGSVLRRSEDLRGAHSAYHEALELTANSPILPARLNSQIHHAYIDCLLDRESPLATLIELGEEAEERDLMFLRNQARLYEITVRYLRGEGQIVIPALERTLVDAFQLGQRHFIAQELASTPDLLTELFGSSRDQMLLDQLARALSSHPDHRQLLLRAISCGERAAGAVLTSACPVLSDADAAALARRALRNRSPQVRKLASQIIAASGGSASFIPELTAREFDVLRLLASGRRNQEIAAELVLSPATIKTYVNRIFSKLGVTDRVQAALYYREAETGAAGRPPSSSTARSMTKPAL